LARQRAIDLDALQAVSRIPRAAAIVDGEAPAPRLIARSSMRREAGHSREARQLAIR
jgi:hypothetical protein